MALRELWSWAKGETPQTKSGRIVKFPEKMQITCKGPPAPEPTKPPVMSGWRKAAHAQKQKLFGPKIGMVLPGLSEKQAAVVPTKPVFHVTCAGTGVKVSGGRLWGCHCGRPATFKFKPGEYATDEQIEERGAYA